MSVENVKMFYESVSQDEALKQKFVEISQKYQGQPMDEAKAMAVTEQEVLPLAAQMGYSFTMDDLMAFGEEMKQENINRELSDAELAAVAGSDGTQLVCAFIGVGDGAGASGFCLLVGYGGYNRQSVLCIIGGMGTFR
jgi:predicted ribosomally synthesized peptide with nif11-like leader